jgi:hypothetical protein
VTADDRALTARVECDHHDLRRYGRPDLQAGVHDQQSTNRQNLVSDEAGIEHPVVIEEHGP